MGQTVQLKRQTGRKRGFTLAPYLFISPWIFGFLFFTLGPLCFSLVMSFYDWPVVGERTFVGIDNYRSMVTEDPQFWESLWITVKFAAVYVPFNIIMSFVLALLLHHARYAVGFFRTVFYLPSVISGVALVTIWIWIYSREYGLLNYMLSLAGIAPLNWLGDTTLAMVAIIIASVWGLGGTMLILLTGLKAIPKELYEAATVSGVPGWAQMVFITLPMLGPMLLFTFITSIIAAFQQLTIALLLTKGGPLGSTYFFAMYIYDNAFKYYDMGYAAAGSWIMFLVVLILSMLVMRWSAAGIYYEGELRSGGDGKDA